jgi:hypothetical protein
MSSGKRALPAVVMVLALISAQQARADGGFLRLSERSGPYQVTVFTSPTPLRAGPVDFSVLVQNADTSAVLSDARVVFRTTPPGGAESAVDHLATTRAATNKLLKAAQFDLPSPATWRVDVLMDGPLGRARLEFPVEVSAAMPRWLDMAPWIALPVVPIVLFGLHEALAKRKRPQRACKSRAGRNWPSEPGCVELQRRTVTAQESDHPHVSLVEGLPPA